ncbi:transcriptional regulator, MarR family [Paludibacter propionicigenes WB4]|uniref:Transcriptional regulator, MarR family n=1 Tax=Paludibacter propionicigenes (strain DSM 17365 / JCM 13257 / WB4) TaxID=694427 RepID=E4T146_PALPW|nr:MarR family transcriptional regulator [Paludibacter propionicigenes]ADQ78427.1 transcriptional regulator, MarR family [Paludibacter propionicigenes WB4]
MPDNIISIDSVIENLISIHPLLTKSFTRSIRSKTNLNPGSLYVLGILTRHGKLSMSEIGCKLSMPKPHITALVDKLILEEMVERLFDPKDRRLVYVQVTPKGTEDFNVIKQEISQEMRVRLELLDEEKIKILAQASQHLKEILMEIFVDNKTDSSCCKIK